MFTFNANPLMLGQNMATQLLLCGSRCLLYEFEAAAFSNYIVCES